MYGWKVSSASTFWFRFRWRRPLTMLALSVGFFPGVGLARVISFSGCGKSASSDMSLWHNASISRASWKCSLIARHSPTYAKGETRYSLSSSPLALCLCLCQKATLPPASHRWDLIFSSFLLAFRFLRTLAAWSFLLACSGLIGRHGCSRLFLIDGKGE